MDKDESPRAKTRADVLAGLYRGVDRDTLKASPEVNPKAAALGRGAAKLHEFASKPFGYNNPAGEMISEGLGIPAVARTLERVGYGEPLTTGKGMTTKPRADTMDALMALTGVAPATKGMPVGASIKGVRETRPFWVNTSTGVLSPLEEKMHHAFMIQDPKYAAKLGVTPEQANAYPISKEAAPLVTGRQTNERLSLVGLSNPNDETLSALQRALQQHGYAPEIVDVGGGELLWEGIPRAEFTKAKTLSELKKYRKHEGDEYKDGGKVEKTATPWLFSVPNYAETVAYEMYPGQKGQDDQRDAARHMLAAGTLAMKYGPRTAELLGKAHEYTTSPLQALKSVFGGKMPADFDMDVHNNAVGIGLGANAKDQDELEQLVMQAAERASRERGQGRAYIRKAVGGSVDIPDDFTSPDMSDGGAVFPDPDYMRLALQQR